MRTLLVQWIQEGTRLKVGEELFIPVDNKPAQTDFYRSIRKELAAYREIDPEESAKLRISTTYKDSKYWVVIKKIAVTPLVAFKKDSTGTVSKVEIVNTREQERIERLKREDRYGIR